MKETVSCVRGRYKASMGVGQLLYLHCFLFKPTPKTNTTTPPTHEANVHLRVNFRFLVVEPTSLQPNHP